MKVLTILAVALYIVCYASGSPNMILYLADDIGQANFTLYNPGGPATPNIDAMARNGTYMDIVWSTPMCQPTRAMFLTGMYAYQTTWWFQANETAPQTINLAKHFGTFANKAQLQGYRTLWVGKMQIGTKGEFATTKEYGFDEYCLWRWADNQQDLGRFLKIYDGPTCLRPSGNFSSVYWHPGPMVINDVYLQTNDSDFSWLIYFDCVKNFVRKAKAANQKFLIWFADDLCHADINPQNNCNFDVYPPLPILDKAGKMIGKRNGSVQNCVEFVDTGLGLLKDFIKAEGLWNDTVLMFSTDNPVSGNGKKQVNGQVGTIVPFFAYGGPIKKRSKSINYAPFGFSDFYATVLEFIGSPPDPSRPDSASFKKLLTGESNKAPRQWILSYYDVSRMIRTPQWILDGFKVLFDCRSCRDHNNCCKLVSNTSLVPGSQLVLNRFNNLLSKLERDGHANYSTF